MIAACAETPRPGETGTWINDEMIAAYTRLHEEGFAHSCEVWRNGNLVGGLYGVSLGGAFFAESMFHRERDASKVAFVTLVRWLEARGFTLFDCQLHTDHLASLGAREIPRDEYLQRLDRAARQPTLRGPWTLEGSGAPEPAAGPGSGDLPDGRRAR